MKNFIVKAQSWDGFKAKTRTIRFRALPNAAVSTAVRQLERRKFDDWQILVVKRA